MKLLVCVAFHYVSSRLQYLRKILKAQALLTDQVHVCVLTNTTDEKQLAEIYSVAPSGCSGFLLEIYLFDRLPHPYLLPWMHKLIFKKFYYSEDDFTHFMYVEDDIEVLPQNVFYWVEAREALKPYGLFPSFFRVEWSELSQDWVSTDVYNAVSITQTPSVEISGVGYVNMPNPYQGMSFYDRELLDEHLYSPSSDILQYANLGGISALENNPGYYWDTRERATFGQIAINVPNGFYSRNVVPYSIKYRMLDCRAFVHHLPNNYANDLTQKFGKLKVSQMLSP